MEMTPYMGVYILLLIRLFQFFYYVFVFTEIILVFGFRDSTVFDGSYRAVTDTGHTVGTLITPNRFHMFDLNIV